MRFVVLKPNDCHFDITQLMSECLIQEAQKVEISSVLLLESIEDLRPNDLVLYRFSSDFQNCKFRNTPECHLELSKYIQSIENKGCIAFPSSYMLQFYENKKRMYELFIQHGIKFPKTFFVTRDTWKNSIPEYTFPILLKHPFSCSSHGMKQLYSLQELEATLEQEFQESSEIILQNKIQARREARITYFGESLFHGYYRIRRSLDDMSAATSFGSFCDYSIDLEKHKSLIDRLNYDCGISMGGVDILWENDDETSEPYVLEVSPIFEINPPPPPGWTLPYKDWKEHPDFHLERRNTLRIAAREYIQFALQEYYKPRLYIDIDHTICDSQPRILKYPSDYKKQEYVLQDKPFQEALAKLNEFKKTHTLLFISARNSYEEPFLTTRNWLFKHAVVYRGLILCDNLHAKCNILSNVDNNISFYWIDDCTVSDDSGGRCLESTVVDFAKQNSIPLVLIESDSSWAHLHLT
jgi:glutathione synthase/RimK-type ligase-like ATP-grasp enzyme